jgi:hypothetical protein
MAEMTDDEAKEYTATEAYALARAYLPIWVVCRPTTSDFPGWWVARMHLTMPKEVPTTLVVTGGTLAEVRCKLPPGLVMLKRDADDDPVIEEVWL